MFFKDPSEATLGAIFNSVNALDLTHVARIPFYQKVLLRNGHDATQQELQVQLDFAGTRMKVKVPTTLFADEVGDLQCLTLVRKFGPAVMQIYNALLLEKKVIFLGTGCPADEVCTYVLSAVSTWLLSVCYLVMYSPPVRSSLPTS